MIDNFNFRSYKDLVRKNPVRDTKRGVSSLITQWWDIMGYAEPFKLAGKLILQRCWQTQNNGQNLNWDDRLPDDILNDWTQWKKDVEKVAEMELPRYIFEGLESPPKELFLHGFCDGGEKAYGIVTYIRFFDPKIGKYKTRLLFSSSRVAPTNKPLSTPRKELAGAAFLVEIVLKIAEHWDVPNTHIFLHCDSKVVLQWIKQDTNKQTVWVRNRVLKIQRVNLPFFWTPTHKNPADKVSKVTQPKNYVNNVSWTEAPTYLQDPEEKWKIEYKIGNPTGLTLTEEESK